MSTLPPVVIGIPTFRRPDLLAILLTSLRPEIEGRDARVIVADNDPGPATPRVIEENCPSATYVPVDERGISQVRNAIIRTALALEEPWEWLIMLDDDGYVHLGWLAGFVEAARRFDADAASGPVLRDLPPDASILARNSMFAERPRRPDGPIPTISGAQNLALARQIVERMEPPWFDPELGLIGGEDHHFFRRLEQMGATFVWCDSAEVTETTSAERLTTRAILSRAFRSNLIAAQSDVRFLGRGVVLRGIGAGLRRTARNTAAAVTRRDADRLAKSGLSLVSLGGRTGGLLTHKRPTREHGS